MVFIRIRTQEENVVIVLTIALTVVMVKVVFYVRVAIILI